MGFRSATITMIDNGFILRIDYAMSASRVYYKTADEVIRALENVLPEGHES